MGIFSLSSERRLTLLSIGQIRPEKNHRLQLEIVRALRDQLETRGEELEVRELRWLEGEGMFREGERTWIESKRMRHERGRDRYQHSERGMEKELWKLIS